jgi:hypothetical protein
MHRERTDRKIELFGMIIIHKQLTGLFGLTGNRYTRGRRLQNVCVTFGPNQRSGDFLLTRLDVPNPFVRQDVVEARSVFDANFEHATDYVTTLAREEPEEPPRPLDDFLALSRLLRRAWWERRSLLACGAGRFVATIWLVVAIGCCWLILRTV